MAKRMRLIYWQQSFLAGIMLVVQVLSTASFPVPAQAQNASVDAQPRIIRPTDSEYRALQSLIQKYDCIANWDKTWLYKHTLLTSYEFAAVLLSCGDTFDRLLAMAPERVAEQDSSLLQRLQWAYAEEASVVWKAQRGLEERTRRFGQRYVEKRFCIFDLIQDVCVTQLPPPEFQRLNLQRIQLPKELFNYPVNSPQSTRVPTSISTERLAVEPPERVVQRFRNLLQNMAVELSTAIDCSIHH